MIKATSKVLLLLVPLVVGCDSVEPCVCPANFGMVGVTVLSPAGDPVTDLAFTVTLTRTQEVLDVPQPLKDRGYYVVIDDSFKNQIRSGGDILHTEMKSGQVSHAQAYEVDVPGRCKCHVSKLSGPDTLVFDG